MNVMEPNFLLFGEDFRKLQTSDFDLWLPFHKNPLSFKHWEDMPKDPLVACQHWFDKAFYRYENNLGGMNVLEAKSNQAFIGQCGLLKQTVDGIEELEVGYSILPKYWRQGYATEAAIKCKVFAQEHKLAKTLISIIHVNNIASQKVAINNGMLQEKTTIYQNNPVHIFRVTI